MKRLLKSIGIIAAVTAALSGCVSKPKIPEKWYEKTLEYYSEGFSDNWKNETTDLYVAEEMKDPDNKYGYLLKDLDGDGADELLIGVIDDSDVTKFIDVFIWHSDVGAFRIFHSGDDFYLYLCDDNILREDSWYGSKTTKTRYLKYQPENNSFLVVNEGSDPRKCELTAF